MVGGWRALRRAVFEKMVIRSLTDRHCPRCPAALFKMTAFGGPRTVRADEKRGCGRTIVVGVPAGLHFLLFSSEIRSRGGEL